MATVSCKWDLYDVHQFLGGKNRRTRTQNRLGQTARDDRRVINSLMIRLGLSDMGHTCMRGADSNHRISSVSSLKVVVL